MSRRGDVFDRAKGHEPDEAKSAERRSARSELAHFVQFYDNDRFIVEKVSRWAGRTLRTDGSSVLLATRPHLVDIETRLNGFGIHIDSVRAQGRYVALDAATTLKQFMIGGSPDEIAFHKVIGDVITKANARSGNHFVSVFGEMVALLCATNNSSAAIHLEKLWNDLTRAYRFSLCCAYP